MGLMEFLRQWQRGRLAAGVAVSVLLHLILVALAVGIRLPTSRYETKRGDALIVELPKSPEAPPPRHRGRTDFARLDRSPLQRLSRASAAADQGEVGVPLREERAHAGV